MRVLFVQMHRRYYRPGVDEAQRATSPPYMESESAPEPGWAADLVSELARLGHEPTLAQLDSPGFVSSRLGGDDPWEALGADGVRRVVTASPHAIRPLVSEADAVVLRKDHRLHGELFAGIRLRGRPVATILTNVAGRRPRFSPKTKRFTMLANDATEVERLSRRRRVRAELFLKPPARVFEDGAETGGGGKTYDVIQVLYETGRPRKRFDLLLASMAELDRLVDGRVRVAVVGNSEAHAEPIAATNGRLANVTIERLGLLRPADVARAFRSSRVSVVTSQRDPNPRVIAESLACDVPVACASDIAGGSFQITDQTGELFEPEPLDLAMTLAKMLADLSRFRARAGCVTLERSARQLERILSR